MQVNLPEDELLPLLFQHKRFWLRVAKTKGVFLKPAKKCKIFFQTPQERSQTINFNRQITESAIFTGMNKNIRKLFDISSKTERLVIGLMSGTSFDGLDVALCKISGSGLQTRLELLEFETVAYQNDFKEDLK